MDTKHSNARKFRMSLNILGIFLIMAFAFPAASSASAEGESPQKVGLVATTTGLHDNSFNELAYQGLLRAAANLQVVASTYEPLDQSEYDDLMQQCANENELCIVVGFEFRISLPDIARANPEIMWGIVDWSYPDCWEGEVEGVDCGSFTEIPNIRGLRFNEKEAGYLAGVLAGAMTTSKVVGAVGGMEIPPVVAFVDGYRNGAQCTTPDVTVLTSYTGTFSDPDLGATTAQEMIAQGADVIFGAAGLTGDGAITYSAQNGQWAIGVDSDQYLNVFGNGSLAGSDKLLSSAMKRVDNAVYQTIADFVNDTFASGITLYDLAIDGVGLAPFHDTDGSISQEIKDNLDAVEQGIINGTINIDDSCVTPPNPFIAVSLTQHWFWVNNFTPETGVTFSIYDDPDDESPILEFSKPTDALGNLTIDGWEHIWDPEPGNYIVATDGTHTKDLVLEDISLNMFDPENDLVSGYALPGREVGVGVGNETGEQWMTVFADESTGVWTADFTLEGFEFDITEDSWAGGHVNDEDGDVTAAHNTGPSEPPAWFTVFPEWDAIEGWNFPLGAVVHLEIDDPNTEGSPDYEQDEPVVFTPWESWELWVWFDLAGKYDVKAGDVVTLAYGETVRTHTVQHLAVTKVNPEDNIVKGVADAGNEVYVWPHATGQEQVTITNPKGKWNVDFTGIYDLMPGDGGRARIWDKMGNATEVEWYMSQPRFTVYPDAQWFDGIDWPDGATVTITVKNKPECTFTRESWGNFFNGGFPEGCTVTASDHVTFTDETTTRKHTVRNLAIAMIDKEADKVFGFADTGSTVHTWVWNSDGSTLDGSNLEVTVVDGMWLADYGALDIDLEVGLGIQAEIRDENGNATSVDLPVPDPRVVASITEDWFYIADFIPGSILDLAIYEKQGGSPVWQGTRTADVNGFAWIDSVGWDLIPDNYLVVSDGNTTKDLVVEGFTFDVFNVTNGQLSGTAPEPYGRNVWVGIGWENDGWYMDATTDEDGAWLVDFGQPVPSDFWWVAAQIFDDDGDASELRPASQVIFLRPSCGSTYTVQAGSFLEIRYGSWVAIGEELAIQNAEHLTVDLVLNGETVTGEKQLVVPRSEIPCGSPPEDAYGVFYIAQIASLSPGTYIAEVTWRFDQAVTDGYDADGDGEPNWYGPGVVSTREFTLIVP